MASPLPKGVVPKTPQAVGSNTFVTPPLDFSLDIAAIYDFNLHNSPNHPAFVYYDADDGDALHYITRGDVGRAVHRAAAWVESQIAPAALADTVGASPNGSRGVVGLLLAADLPTGAAVVVGLLRQGFTVFPMSPRNSPAALAHLLRRTAVSHVVVSVGTPVEQLAHAALQSLANDDQGAADATYTPPALLPLPTFAHLYPSAGPADVDPPPARKVDDMDTTAMILPSSGTTSAFPKPISLSHRILIQMCMFPYFGDVDLCGVTFGTHSHPLFHFMGVHSILLMGPTVGCLTACFKPGGPLRPPPTADELLDAFIKTRTDLASAVPLYLEVWSRDPEAVKKLATHVEYLFYGGGPLSKEAGDRLVEGGAKLRNGYGATELGLIMPIVSKEPYGLDWQYITITPQYKAIWDPQNDGDGTCELLVEECETLRPAVFNDPEGRPIFHSNDLFQPHPTRPGLWRVVGRKDDTITLSSGEKTNPGPIEHTIQESPLVAASVMFGRERAQTGIIIEPTPGNEVQPGDERALAEFRNRIWHQVEVANAEAPGHSRLYKEMILVAAPDKPLPRTAKMTVRRGYALTSYADEIQQCYDLVEAQTPSHNVGPPDDWRDHQQVLRFVSETVNSIMRADIGPDEDVFAHGCDSLTATYIRNSIVFSVRRAENESPVVFPPDFVYQHPTPASLAAATVDVVQVGAARSPSETKVEVLRSLVDKYTHNFPVRHPASAHHRPSSEAFEVVLITGTTGFLGANLLAHMSSLSSVAKVYALIRPSPSPGTKSSTERQVAALKRIGCDDDSLVQSILSKTVVLEGDILAPGLGLQDDMYAELTNSVTSIVHNAWRLNFRMSVRSFEPLIASVRHLLDLALRSTLAAPPRFVFVSSVAAVGSWKIEDGPVPEAMLSKEELCLGTGYGESKYVSERIVEAAREASGGALVANSVRVGQLSGATPSGAWAPTDWVPVLLRASKQVGCLPNSDSTVSWLPLDVAAHTLADIALTAPHLSSPSTVYHVVSPQPTPWSTVFGALSDALGLPLVSFREWLGRVEKSVAADASDPTEGLLGFFRHRPDLHMPMLATERAQELSRSLRSASGLTDGDVKRWVDFWHRDGSI